MLQICHVLKIAALDLILRLFNIHWSVINLKLRNTEEICWFIKKYKLFNACIKKLS